MKENNGREFRNKYIVLNSSSSLNLNERDSLAEIFLSDTVFAVRDQFWLKEDVLFYLGKAKFIYGIRKKGDRNFIGYVCISDDDHCFEVLIVNSQANRGYGVYAALLSIDKYFQINPSVKKISTRIHAKNMISFNQAVKFGWRLKDVEGDWTLLTLDKEEFYIRHRFKLETISEE